jgi:hypothetical protein
MKGDYWGNDAVRKPTSKPNPLTNGEESLEDEVDRAMAMFRNPVPETRECVREDLRLSREYPGKLVAYIDTWRRRGGERRLTRTVLAAAANPWELDKQLDRQRVAPTKRKKMVVDFIPDPAQGLPSRW